MFCSKTSHKKIEEIQKRGLQIVYNEPHMSPEELLIHDQDVIVHSKHINTSLTEIYKTFSEVLFYKKYFHEKWCNIQSKGIKSPNTTKNKYKNVWSLLF